MSEQGHILLHRQLLDSEVFANPTALKIWIWLLFKASYKQRFVPLKIGNGQTTISLERGQLLFGRFKAEEALGIDGSTVYKWIHKMQDRGMIKIESNSHSTIISIEKYDIYQTQEVEEVTAEEQPSNNQVTAEEQPCNTNNKVKKVKKVNNNNNISQKIPTRQELLKIYFDTGIEIFNDLKVSVNKIKLTECAEEFCDFWIGNDEIKGEWLTNKKYKNRIINPKSTAKYNITKFKQDYIANYDKPYKEPELEKTPEEQEDIKRKIEEDKERIKRLMEEMKNKHDRPEDKDVNNINEVFEMNKNLNDYIGGFGCTE